MNAINQRITWILAAIFISLFVICCGGNNTYSATTTGQGIPPVITVSITPGNGSCVAGGTIQFTATVTGTSNKGVTWTAVENQTTVARKNITGISSNGLFTAPLSPGTYTISATSVVDATAFGTATATVSGAAPITVTVVPATDTLVPLSTLQYQAIVTGTTNQNVTWKCVPANSDQNGTGSITASGLFSCNYFSGDYLITATSVADPTKSGTGTMTISGSSAVKITATPPSIQIFTGQTIQCSATVTGNSNTSVYWQIQPVGVGTISQTGLYTAPQTGGNTTIYVQSQVDPTKSVAIPVVVNVG